MLRQFWQPSQRLVLQLADGRFGAKTKEKFFGFHWRQQHQFFQFFIVRLASQQKSKKRNSEDNNFRRSTTSIPRTSRPCFKTRAVKSQSVKCDSRTAPAALSAGQLFWQRRFKFVQRAFSLREIALEPQSFTKFSRSFRWFAKSRQHIAQLQMNLGIIRRKS